MSARAQRLRPCRKGSRKLVGIDYCIATPPERESERLEWGKTPFRHWFDSQAGVGKLHSDQ